METPLLPPTGRCRGVSLLFTLAAFYNRAADGGGRPLGPLAAHLLVPGRPLNPLPQRRVHAGSRGGAAWVLAPPPDAPSSAVAATEGCAQRSLRGSVRASPHHRPEAQLFIWNIWQLQQARPRTVDDSAEPRPGAGGGSQWVCAPCPASVARTLYPAGSSGIKGALEAALRLGHRKRCPGP